jgi:hypothetical protein
MPNTAKAYIALVITAGTALMVLAAASWSSSNTRQCLIYLGLAVLASTLKVRIPGMEGTVSPSFLFLLLAMSACQFPEVVVIAFTSAIVQTLWASSKRPRLVQLAFSAAALVVSSAIGYAASHRLLSGTGPELAVSRVILAGSLYFPVNSALVSAVISLVEGQRLSGVLSRCYQSVFPYFVGGIAFAALVTGFYADYNVWKGALSLAPVVVFSYLYSVNRVNRTLMAVARVSPDQQ